MGVNKFVSFGVSGFFLIIFFSFVFSSSVPVFYESFDDLNSIRANRGRWGGDHNVPFKKGVSNNAVEFSVKSNFFGPISYYVPRVPDHGTIEYWVYPLSSDWIYNSDLYVAQRYKIGSSKSGSDIKFLFQLGWGWDKFASVPNNSLGWHKAVLTFDCNKNGEMVFYADGRKLITVNSINECRGFLWFGFLDVGNPWAPSEVSNSIIDEVKIFDYAKTYEEIKQDYSAEFKLAVACSSNKQCGANGWVDSLYCKTNTKIWGTYRSYTCMNPGKVTSYCTFSDVNKQKTVCSSGKICNNAVCVTPVCAKDSKCNDKNSLTIDTCLNPNTIESVCVHTPIICASNKNCEDNNFQTKNICVNPKKLESYCIFPYAGFKCNSNSHCNDNNVLSKDVCVNPGGKSSYCKHTLVPQVLCSANFQCDDNNPKTDDVCMNPGKTSSYCSHKKAEFMRGMNYVSWWYNQYASSSSDTSITELRNNTKSNWVSILVTQYLSDLGDKTIGPNANKTPTDAGLVRAINKAHSLGMKVSLKPHVDVGYNSSTWRGYISYSSESDWQSWFDSYKTFINHYADIAKANNVEMFVVGTELVGTSKREGDWRGIVEGVRARFPGKIVYAANHDEYKNVNWWDAVDYVGIDSYFSLTYSTNPTVKEMQDSFAEHMLSATDFASSFGKDVLITEIGYQSRDGTNITPWYSSGEIDLQEQADAYKATLEVMKTNPNIAGAFWWNWLSFPGQGGAYDGDFTPYGKPAEDVLLQYYSNSFAFEQ